MVSALLRLGSKLRRLLGLAGDLHFCWSIVQYLLPNGAVAGLVTYLVGWRLSFVDYVAELPILLRAGFFVCVFVVLFALVNHTRRQLPALWKQLAGQKPENQEVKQSDWALAEHRRRQDYRRKRIKEWRSVILNFDFDNERFTSTDAYSQMRPHLLPDVKRRLEHPGMIILGNVTRGEHAHRYILRDEVARIEREWGLV